MRPLRIASVCRLLPSPVDPAGGIFVLNRIAAMSRAADVTVVQPVPYCPLLAPLPSWARDPSHRAASVEIQHAPMFYLPGVLKSLDASWLYRAVHAQIRSGHRAKAFDALDAHFGYPEGVAITRLARALSIPHFITIRGFEHEFADRALIGAQMVSALAASTGVVAVSHSLKEFAVSRGIDPEQVRVVHNAIDRTVFAPGDRSEARRQLGMDDNARLIVAVGNQIVRKRHHVLIDAFATVRAAQPEARLVIIGAAPSHDGYAAALRKQVADRGLAPSVDFAGNLPPGEVAAWLRAADVFALATAREGCCNAVLEALAAGCPVVTTPAGDNRYFVRDGENGFVVPIDDRQALAAALSEALKPGRWNAAAISQGLEVGNWDDVAGKVLEFFGARIEQQRRAA